MIRDGDPYALSDGQRVPRLPAGSRHMGGARRGVKVISSDPGARRIGAPIPADAFYDDELADRCPPSAIPVNRPPGSSEPWWSPRRTS